MQKKVMVILGFGFIMGLGLASCATSPDRDPASMRSGTRTKLTDEKQQVDKPRECMLGESRNEDGDCVREHQFDRPFRKGGH